MVCRTRTPGAVAKRRARAAEDAALARLAAFFDAAEAHFDDPEGASAPTDPHVRRLIAQIEAGVPLDDALDTFLAAHEQDAP